MNLTRKHILTVISVCVAVTLLSWGIYSARQNYLYTNRDRMVILCYQTNITGSDGENWAKNLKDKFNFIPDCEVGVYITKQAGNENITVTSENGWAQIVTRLAAKQGDILLVNNRVFYETLLKSDLILPLEYSGNRGVTDENGTVYGLDFTSLKFDSLINLETSDSVGFGQPLPLKSIDEEYYSDMNPRVIAVVYKGSKQPEDAKKILYSLIAEGEK